MAPKRQRSPSPVGASHETWISSKIEDRESIFIAYFSPTTPPKQLQSNPEIKSASHRMLAWRTPGSQRTLSKSRAIESGSDDDGENYGGKRVLKVLEEMRVEGALVVARWYGGVMLGPVRFNHIEDCARNAILAWKQSEASESQKRRKLEDEAKEKIHLVVDLKERDQSIKVLRGLLEEKTAALKNETQKSSASVPSREIDYSVMTVERLRQMEKARDGTLAFLLKRIDEIEKQAALASATQPEKSNEEAVSQTDNNTNSPATVSESSVRATTRKIEAALEGDETNDNDAGHVDELTLVSKPPDTIMPNSG